VIEIVRQCDAEDLTASLAAGLAAVVRPGDRLALRGDLGAGKTTFVRHLAAALGVPSGMVSSPTFVMVNQYPARGGLELVHADFYRLTAAEDLDSLGWDRLAGPTAVVLAEWPDRAPGALGDPDTIAEITLEATGVEGRRITLRLADAWRERPGVEALMSRPPTVCRVTGRPVPPTADTYPFADEKARLADLGAWLDGGFRISRDVTERDLEEG
jgi:tRNA threonylcarbamoyl adenosine modification protein YjeE